MMRDIADMRPPSSSVAARGAVTTGFGGLCALLVLVLGYQFGLIAAILLVAWSALRAGLVGVAGSMLGAGTVWTVLALLNDRCRYVPGGGGGEAGAGSVRSGFASSCT